MKKAFPILLQIVLLALSLPAAAKDFGQTDLEKIVTELDKVIPENPKYKYPIKCSIVNKDEVNAYATLTKEGADYRATMVVFTGLVKQIGGDERLIRAVVAHELSHLSLGHNMDVNPAARDLNNLWVRQQEFEADKSGAEALVKAGHPKKDMVDMLLFLERQRSRQGDWLGRLTTDHADPKARAAEVSDDPTALQALLEFDMALAYEDARKHNQAKVMFTEAAKNWPPLTIGYINAARCSALDYYDNVSVAVLRTWWRPDFGPLLTMTPEYGRGTELNQEDRERWSDALDLAKTAVAKNPASLDAQEILALVQVLEPDAKKDVVQTGIDWFKGHMSAADEPGKLRYANNAGVGFQRTGRLQEAYDTIMAAQKGSDLFNSSLGENLGLVKVTGRTKADDELAADVLFTWLSNTPQISPRWATVKKTFDEVCTSAGITPKPIEQKPAYLCAVMTLVTSGKELGVFMPVEKYYDLLGQAELRTTFTKRFTDLAEIRWHTGNIAIFTERGHAMRVTSYEPGAYLLLKPVDKTSQATLQIKVGMSKDDLFSMLNEKAAVPKDLARAGQVEKWLYFPDLQMGVMLDGDKVKAITVTSVKDDSEE